MNTVDAILDALQEFANAERVAKMKTYAPTEMEVLGVSNPDLKRYMKTLVPELREISQEALLQLCTDLVERKHFECQMLAWSLLDKFKMVPALTKKDARKLEGILDNWASVDTYGVLVYGVLWRIGTIKDTDVYRLQESSNLWYRRLALVATVALNLKSRGGTGDTERTIAVCSHAAKDHEDMVIKALSWSLRALIRWDHDAVRAFLERHDEELHNRVKREVNHKLQYGTKN